MLTIFRKIGHITINFLRYLGKGHIFLLQSLIGILDLYNKPKLILKQIYAVGVLSLSIIMVSGLFVGMVLGLQGYNTLVDFGATQSLGMVVTLSLVRELGPVLTSLLFAGRAGSALTAEIGLMKATEQLSGMEMMAVNPIKRIIAPRLIAGIISMPLLAMIFSAIGILGGHFIVVNTLGVDAGAYWQMSEKVDVIDDIFNGVIKSFVFGIVVTWIAVFEGYNSIPTSEGVSQATTRTVVNASLATLGLDFLLTALMFNN
jgi:phospholipid/cholesterol/gamma-HCH transport system permease protein